MRPLSYDGAILFFLQPTKTIKIEKSTYLSICPFTKWPISKILVDFVIFKPIGNAHFFDSSIIFLVAYRRNVIGICHLTSLVGVSSFIPEIIHSFDHSLALLLIQHDWSSYSLLDLIWSVIWQLIKLTQNQVADVLVLNNVFVIRGQICISEAILQILLNQWHFIDVSIKIWVILRPEQFRLRHQLCNLFSGLNLKRIKFVLDWHYVFLFVLNFNI